MTSGQSIEEEIRRSAVRGAVIRRCTMLQLNMTIDGDPPCKIE